MSEPARVLVVGTGAMACLFAARLSQAGVDVQMFGSWVEGIASLNRNGVRLVGADGKTQLFPVRATSDPAECKGVRLALVLVKSWQSGKVSYALADCMPPNGLALTLQNGLGNRERLAHQLGARRVATGVTTVGANLLGPGIVALAGEGVVSLGRHVRLKPMAELLVQAGFVVETLEDIDSLQWGKLIINAAINPLSAILGVSNGALLQRPSARKVLTAAAREAGAVAVGKGISLPFPDPVLAVESIARRTASNYSSMLQDIRRGFPTEVDNINGAVVKAGEQVGVAAPVNRTLWLAVKAMGEKGTER